MSEVVVQVAEGSGNAMVRDSSAPRTVRRRNEHGMVSAEWAVGLIAAIAIAGVLLAVVTNGAVKQGLLTFILLVIKAFSTNL